MDTVTRKKPEGFTKTDYNFAARRLGNVVEYLADCIYQEYFLQKLLLEHFKLPRVGMLDMMNRALTVPDTRYP